MGVLAVTEIITVRENKSNGIRCNRNNKIPQCKSRICRYQSGRSGFWVFLCEENPGDHHGANNTGTNCEKTLGFLRKELDEIGVQYTEKFGKSSIVAVINPEKSHYTIGIRADMDALPIIEENDVDYKSRIKGKMHACGHDAHTAIALATLKELYEERDRINCCVKFLFQSGEEAYCGAKYMVDDGAAEGIDCIVALHVNVTCTVGQIRIMPGAINANADHFTLEFFGNASHAVRQQNGTDANMTAIKAYNAIEFMVAKEVEPHDVVVFNAGEIKGGTANNIISDYCVMNCTLRTWNDKTEQKLLDGIKNISELTAKMSGATAKYTQLNRYPALYNDDIVVERVKNAAAKVIGTENVLPQDERSLGAEDFAYFANEKPSALFWLGVANNEREFSGTHTSGFDIDENALDVGVNIFKQFVFDNMDNTRDQLKSGLF